MKSNIADSCLKSAGYNFSFQLVTRIITFLLNAFMVRRISTDVLGLMNVRLLLLESMILFLSKEPFKKACPSNAPKQNWPQIVNLQWLSVFIGCIMSLIFGYIWLHFLQTPEIMLPSYNKAVYAFSISCVIELLSMVVEIIAEAFLFIKLKPSIEAIKITVRTVSFVIIYIFISKDALLAFGIAQLIASFFYTCSYYVYFWQYLQKKEYVQSEFPFTTMRDFLPLRNRHKSGDQESYFDKNLFKLTSSFIWQSFLKQLLTEGEKLIMTVFLSHKKKDLALQGEYEVVNNLASLPARLIFRTIEDSSHKYFSQRIDRDKPINSQDPEKMHESANNLKNLCLLMSSLGLIILAFGWSYSSMFLWYYGGDNLTTPLAVLLLKVHCVAVLFQAINGITEGYMNATADNKAIDKNNWKMIQMSIGFVAYSLIFVWTWGVVGFIVANCVNMGLRIVISSNFIKSRYSESNYQPLSGLYPKATFTFWMIISFLITLCSESYSYSTHLLIGILMFCLVIISWASENQDLIELGLIKWFEDNDATNNSSRVSNYLMRPIHKNWNLIKQCFTKWIEMHNTAFLLVFRTYSCITHQFSDRFVKREKAEKSE